jgi:hypothetical protein
MNDILSQAVAQLNLQPGQSQHVQVNGYVVEIRRPLAEEESEFANMVMLEPWTDFPPTGPAFSVPCHPGKLSLPDPPDIPSDFNEDDS